MSDDTAANPEAGPALAPVLAMLVEAAEPERVPVLQRFFKTGPGEYGEGDRFRGIRVPAIRRVARTHRDLALHHVESLLASSYHEDRLLALLVLVGKFRRAELPERERIFRLYLARRDRINSWDLVDVSADRIVGAHLDASDLTLLDELAASSVVWDRRIAVMATFHFIRKGSVGPTLRLAGRLVRDPEDLVQKAVGWMLREVGKRDLAAERRFLDRHAAAMPRTMLRYAIERMEPKSAASLSRPAIRTRRLARSTPGVRAG